MSGVLLAVALSLSAETMTVSELPVGGRACGRLAAPDGGGRAVLTEHRWRSRPTEIKLLFCEAQGACRALVATSIDGTLSARWTPQGALEFYASPAQTPSQLPIFQEPVLPELIARSTPLAGEGTRLDYDPKACGYIPPLGSPKPGG